MEQAVADAVVTDPYVAVQEATTPSAAVEAVTPKAAAPKCAPQPTVPLVSIGACTCGMHVRRYIKYLNSTYDT